MRVLIVGAGVAGLALAARLAQQNREIVVIERATDNEQGYAIGLYPLGSCVLHGIGAYEEFVAAGHIVETYELADRTGRRLQSMDLRVLTDGVGPMVMLDRAGLLDLLERAAGVPVQRGTALTGVIQDADGVEVTFGDDDVHRFDLVVGCDGIGSATRELVFGSQPGFDTGWVLWTWWATAGRFDPTVFREYWGSGWFFGVYPSPGQVMCAAGGPASTFLGSMTDGSDTSASDVAALLQDRVQPLAGVERSIEATIDELDHAYPWPMRDVRSRHWFRGRVALCGDAAVAFLPTAGVGASNALRAASALADELSRADASSIPLALELFEKRCRHVVERNQTESRRLARLMFVRSNPVTWGRDQLARRYKPERVLSQIIDSVHQPF